MYWFNLAWQPRSYFIKNLIKIKTIATTSGLFKLRWKKQKTTIKNDHIEEFNKIENFDKNKKLIDGNTINLGDLVSIKCYIKYWRHFASKQHRLTLELVAVKILDQVNLIKNSYDTHRLIIWTQCP